MPRGTRPTTTKAKRREEATFLFLAGRTMSEIAAQFGVNQSTISRDIRDAREDWAKRYTAAIDERKREELAKIDHLERTYWQAWDNSCTERVEQSTGMTASGGKTAHVKKVQRDGDPRYLDGVRWCIEQRCKIYGIYAAAKMDVSTDGPIPISIVKMPVDEL